jgi:putative ABC transport system permease protein
MLLSRASGREKEMAIRAALGASRRALVRQLLVESLLLALLGALVGCFFSYGGIKLLVSAIPEGLIPREAVIRLNMPVQLFSLVIAVLTAILFGLAPALLTVRRDLVNPLRDSGKGTSGGYRRGRLSSALVVGEVALSLVLLAGAGLLTRSFVALQKVDLGLDPENLLNVPMSLASSQHRTAAAQTQFLSQVLARVRTLPGVLSATSTTGLLSTAGGRTTSDSRTVARRPLARDLPAGSDGYFQTLGSVCFRARSDARDLADARRVAVVNRMFVERYLGGRDAIGRRIKVKTKRSAGPDDRGFEIVGVVPTQEPGIQEPSFPEVVIRLDHQARWTRAAREDGRSAARNGGKREA